MSLAVIELHDMKIVVPTIEVEGVYIRFVGLMMPLWQFIFQAFDCELSTVPVYEYGVTNSCISPTNKNTWYVPCPKNLKIRIIKLSFPNPSSETICSKLELGFANKERVFLTLKIHKEINLE